MLATDPNKGGTGRPGVVYADDPDGGRRLNLTLAEDNAFWTWAIVEVLRHTGLFSGGQPGGGRSGWGVSLCS